MDLNILLFILVHITFLPLQKYFNVLFIRWPVIIIYINSHNFIIRYINFGGSDKEKLHWTSYSDKGDFKTITIRERD